MSTDDQRDGVRAEIEMWQALFKHHDSGEPFFVALADAPVAEPVESEAARLTRERDALRAQCELLEVEVRMWRRMTEEEGAEVEGLRRVVDAVVAYVPTVKPCLCLGRRCRFCTALDRLVRELPQAALAGLEAKPA